MAATPAKYFRPATQASFDCSQFKGLKKQQDNRKKKAEKAVRPLDAFTFARERWVSRRQSSLSCQYVLWKA